MEKLKKEKKPIWVQIANGKNYVVCFCFFFTRDLLGIKKLVRKLEVLLKLDEDL